MFKWMRFGKGRRRKNQDNRQIAITLCQTSVVLVIFTSDEQNNLCIEHCERAVFETHTHLQAQTHCLKQWVERYELHGQRASWVLLPDDYQAFMLNMPNVPDDERNDAVKWQQIKDKITFPIESALIDTCLLPNFNQSAPDKLLAFVANEDELLETKQLIESSGLTLQCIDVATLALGNIANDYAKAQEVVLLVHLSSYESKLIACYENKLYFIRQIPLTVAELSSEKDGDRLKNAFTVLAEQIKESWHYIVHQMQQTPAVSVLFTPLPFNTNELETYLNTEVELPILFADLNRCFSLETPLSIADQPHCLFALGSLLKKDFESNATKN